VAKVKFIEHCRHVSEFQEEEVINPLIEIQEGFEVLTAVSMKMDVFWVVAPCSLVDVYQRFRGPCCLHHQDDSSRLHGATTQKTAIFEIQELSMRT
jgi:hypothetical protein